jgi:hypothetical protein
MSVNLRMEKSKLETSNPVSSLASNSIIAKRSLDRKRLQLTNHPSETRLKN